MKKQILRTGLLSLLLTYSSLAHAILIDIPGYDFAAIASLDSSDGTFTSNGASGVSSNISDSEAVTWVMGTSDPASLTLSFGTDIFDGAGIDLSIFFVGAGSHTTDITLFDGTPSSKLNYPNLSPTYTNFCVEINMLPGCTDDVDKGNDQGIFVLDVDFSDFSFLGSNALTQLKLDIGNGAAIPSLVGAYNLNATVVPLPLPIVLFSSGLALLGFVGRKRA